MEENWPEAVEIIVRRKTTYYRRVFCFRRGNEVGERTGRTIVVPSVGGRVTVAEERRLREEKVEEVVATEREGEK